jgi:hypothetical protein
MFENLLSVIKLAGSSLQWALQLGEEKRKNFASLCEIISANLENFASASDDERQSRFLCKELEVYVSQIEAFAKNAGLDDNQLHRMAFELGNVCKTWESNSKKTGLEPHRDGDDLLEVKGAAGHFHGLAELVSKM